MNQNGICSLVEKRPVKADSPGRSSAGGFRGRHKRLYADPVISSHWDYMGTKHVVPKNWGHLQTPLWFHYDLTFVFFWMKKLNSGCFWTCPPLRALLWRKIPKIGNFAYFALGYNAKSIWNKGTCQITNRRVSKVISQNSEGAQVSGKLSRLGTVY